MRQLGFALRRLGCPYRALPEAAQILRVRKIHGMTGSA
jgi:hypothetical protein